MNQRNGGQRIDTERADVPVETPWTAGVFAVAAFAVTVALGVLALLANVFPMRAPRPAAAPQQQPSAAALAPTTPPPTHKRTAP